MDYVWRGEGGGGGWDDSKVESQEENRKSSPKRPRAVIRNLGSLFPILSRSQSRSRANETLSKRLSFRFQNLKSQKTRWSWLKRKSSFSLRSSYGWNQSIGHFSFPPSIDQPLKSKGQLCSFGRKLAICEEGEKGNNWLLRPTIRRWPKSFTVSANWERVGRRYMTLEHRTR